MGNAFWYTVLCKVNLSSESVLCLYIEVNKSGKISELNMYSH